MVVTRTGDDFESGADFADHDDSGLGIRKVNLQAAQDNRSKTQQNVDGAALVHRGVALGDAHPRPG